MISFTLAKSHQHHLTMSASSNDDQVRDQEPKGKTSLAGSTTTSQGQCSTSINDMGEVLVAVLMDNAVNPFMLFQLVSASARAKRAFEHQPMAYLKISISCFTTDISQLVVAYMVLVDKGRRETPWPNLGDAWPRIPSLRHDCIHCGGSMPITWNLEFMDRYLVPERRLPLERLSDPFLVLKKAAAVVEAIQQLSVSNPWFLMARELKNHSPEERLHRTNLALWHLEILCELFGRDWSELQWNCTDGRITTLMQEQRRFFHALKDIDVEDLIRVYDDLSRMLENVYSQELGLIFEARYLSITNKCTKDLSSTQETRVVCSSVEKFAGYIDYRMSLGIVYLCGIDSVRSPDTWPIDAQHRGWGDQWTNSFFTCASMCRVDRRTIPLNYGSPRENQFHLQLVDGRSSDELQKETGPRVHLGLVAAYSANTAGWQLKIRYQRSHHPVFSPRRLKVPQPLLLDWTPYSHVGSLQSGPIDSNGQ